MTMTPLQFAKAKHLNQISKVWKKVFNEDVEIISMEENVYNIASAFDITPHKFDITRNTIAGPKTRTVDGFLVSVWVPTSGGVSSPPDVGEFILGEREEFSKALELIVMYVAKYRAREVA